MKRDFTIYVKWPGGVADRFVYRKTRQVEKIRRGALPDPGKFLPQRWFLQKNATGEERQQSWPARGL